MIGKRLPIQISSRAGGCTFPEDPVRSCAEILPVWSSAMDKRVLVVRTGPPVGPSRTPVFDLRPFSARIIRSQTCEHIRIDPGGRELRLDVVEGSLLSDPVALSFELKFDATFAVQLSALRNFADLWTGKLVAFPLYLRDVARLTALRAADARSAGASLREIADWLLGAGDWPGDGEYRKSQVRRLVARGRALIQGGPRLVLAEREVGDRVEINR